MNSEGKTEASFGESTGEENIRGAQRDVGNEGRVES